MQANLRMTLVHSDFHSFKELTIMKTTRITYRAVVFILKTLPNGDDQRPDWEVAGLRRGQRTDRAHSSAVDCRNGEQNLRRGGKGASRES